MLLKSQNINGNHYEDGSKRKNGSKHISFHCYCKIDCKLSILPLHAIKHQMHLTKISTKRRETVTT